MTDFGFQPGIQEHWMLLSDWRNGSLAILLALLVLCVGYVLATGNKIVAAEGPRPLQGADDAGAKPD
jgi:predicted lysophospholipase L1 biosynthesis ABC-type transport system permease subunit